MKLSDFEYILPPERIAQHPVEPRDAAKLLVVHRSSGRFEHRIFRDLPEYLQSTDVLVINNTRVIPARLRARKTTGGAVEVLLLRRAADARLDEENDVWQVLLRPARRVRIGTRLVLSLGVTAEILAAQSDGTHLVRFLSDRPVLEIAREIGEMPVPPYIHEPLSRPDEYQTVYASVDGAVAAPTAGLHFTSDLLTRLQQMGVHVVSLTLHIGLGTFRQVSEADVRRHHMDAEWYEVTEAAATALNAARKEGGRLVVVGTSAVRTLETVTADDGQVRPGSGWSEVFIYPGHRFHATDVLITNFHLPRTTLLMLVAAFAGRDLIRAYKEAITSGYRFYSFGDAMLIL